MVMIIGTAFSRASASCRERSSIFLHDAELVLKLVDRVLQLLVQHDAIGHHDHAVEDALVCLVVQGKQGRCASQPIVLLCATASRMLNEVVVADALAASLLHQQPDGIELVVARGRSWFRPSPCGLGRRASLRSASGRTGASTSSRLSGRALLPEVGCPGAIACRIVRISGTAVTSLVEGQGSGLRHRLGAWSCGRIRYRRRSGRAYGVLNSKIGSRGSRSCRYWWIAFSTVCPVSGF